jgi:hypothetical protein
MGDFSRIDPSSRYNVSPLILCDRLLSLAQEADQGGFVVAAEHLLDLASEVLEWPSGPPVWSRT